MQWELVHQEDNPWPWGYQSSVLHDVTEFLLREEMTVEELVGRARQVFDEHGLMVLHASLWMPEGREKSRRWLSDVALTSNPQVYPQGIAPQAWWGWLIGAIVAGIGAWWTRKQYEEKIEPPLEALLEALPAFFMLGLMFVVMRMVR